MSDQDRISPYNINTISSRQLSDENKEKYSIGDYQLIQYQILLTTNSIRFVWQTVSQNYK